jgi:hypothetical protein
MDKIKQTISRFFRWVVGNTAWDILKLILGLGIALVPAVRNSASGVLNMSANEILAAVIVFLAVVGALSLLQAPVVWVWNKVRATATPENALRLSIRTGCEPPRGPEAWIPFLVFNESRLDIKECAVWLIEVHKAADTSWHITSPERLHWSSDEGERTGTKDVIAGGSRGVDLANSDHRHNLFYFDGQRAPFDPTGRGDYIARIKINGTYNAKAFVRRHDIHFSYKGGTEFDCADNHQTIGIIA